VGEIHARRLLGAATGRRGRGDMRRPRGITQTQLNLIILSVFVGATKLTQSLKPKLYDAGPEWFHPSISTSNLRFFSFLWEYILPAMTFFVV